MLARFAMGAAGAGGPVEWVAGTRATTSAGANRSVPSHQANDMVVLAEYVSGTTPPALRSGFTNITTAQIRFFNNTFTVRFQFQIDTANSISNITGLSGLSFCFVLRKAKSAGASAFTSSNAIGTSASFSAISGLNTDGRAILVGACFGILGANEVIETVSGPFTATRNNIYGIRPENETASFASGTYMTFPTSVTLSTFIMEFLP